MERIGVCLLAKDGWSLKEVLFVRVEVRQISITKYLEVEQSGLKGKYGADNVRWNINSVDDIFSDPTRLKGYTVDELQTILGNDWTRGVYGSNGGGWKLMNGDISIFYHPGGGKHGGSYYGISSGATGKIKVVNPETYIPLKGDKATVIYD